MGPRLVIVSCLDAILEDGALKAKANFGFRRWGRDLWWSRVWTPSFKMARDKQKLNSKFASLPLLPSWDYRSTFQRGRGARGEGLGLPSLKPSNLALKPDFEFGPKSISRLNI